MCDKGRTCKQAVSVIDTKELDSLQDVLNETVDDEAVLVRMNTFFNNVRKVALESTKGECKCNSH